MFRRRLSRVLIATIVVAGAPLLLTGCRDDKPTGPGKVQPTLENIWPNEDGRSWTFSLLARGWDSDTADSQYVFAIDGPVPDAPNLDTIVALLDDPSQPDSADTVITEYAMEFRGNLTVDSGATGQNLVESTGGVEMPFDCAGRTRPFLAMLAAARPDLEAKLGVLPLQGGRSVTTEHLLIHGGPWERTADWIGGYGCLNSDLGWKFLEKNLSAGSAFTFQLVPSLADDVYLHARVRRHADLETAIGMFANAVEVVYMLDFGRSLFTSPVSPDPIGQTRFITYGYVQYAPTVGPVFSYERSLVPVGMDELGIGIGEVTLEIAGISPGAS